MQQKTYEKKPKVKNNQMFDEKKFLHPFSEGLHGTSAYDPFNFDADPIPGSALGKNGSGSRSFL